MEVGSITDGEPSMEVQDIEEVELGVCETDEEDICPVEVPEGGSVGQEGLGRGEELFENGQ